MVNTSRRANVMSRYAGRGYLRFAVETSKAAGALVLVTAGSAYAAAPQSVDEVVVTASRSAEAIREIPTAVSVVGEDTLREQLALSGDILRALDVTVPGLNLSSGGRSQCLTNIRGRTPSFQINGVPANQDLRPSNCNSAFQLSPFAIERIEVARGATALFGAGSPGGIVNLITRRATSEELEVDAVAQTSFNTGEVFDTFQTDLYAGAGQDFGRFDYYLGGAFQTYDVARDPNGGRVVGTEFDSAAVNGSLGYEVSEAVRLRLTGTWYTEDPGTEYNADGVEVDLGVPFPRVIAVEDNPFRDQGVDKQYTVAATLEADDVLGHSLFFAAFRQEQVFRQRANFQDFNAGAPDFFSDDRENSTTGLRLTLKRPFAIGRVEASVEYGVDYQRNRLLRLLLDPADPSVVTGFIAPEVILNTVGVFGQGDLKLGRVRLTGGVRQEFYRGSIGDELAGLGLPGSGAPGDFDNASLLLVNGGVIVDLSGALQAYASYNQGAELTQLGRAARNAADPSLINPEPAISDQYELGLRGDAGPVNLSAAIFYSESDAASLLQPDPSCAGQSFCPLIPLRVPQRVWGVEGTLNWRAAEWLETGGVFTWQRGEIFDEDLARFIPFGADTVSPTRFTAYATLRPIERVSLFAQATYVAEGNFFSAAEQGLGFINTPAVFLADLNGAVKIGPGRFSVGVSNLFDNSYENTTLAGGGFTPTLAEGRRLTVGYQAQF
jgi:iron complex outermembrane receptor protein